MLSLLHPRGCLCFEFKCKYRLVPFHSTQNNGPAWTARIWQPVLVHHQQSLLQSTVNLTARILQHRSLRKLLLQAHWTGTALMTLTTRGTGPQGKDGLEQLCLDASVCSCMFLLACSLVEKKKDIEFFVNIELSCKMLEHLRHQFMFLAFMRLLPSSMFQLPWLYWGSRCMW